MNSFSNLRRIVANTSYKLKHIIAQGIDYTHLTKLNYPNENFMIRKVSTPNSSKHSMIYHA